MSLSRSDQERLRASRTGAVPLGGERRLRREHVAVLAADHQLDDLVVALLAGAIGGDVAAVAKHRAAIRQLGDLVHAMRDIEQRQPLGAQPLQHDEHLGDVRRRERGGRLVQDEHARVARQRLGDLDHLAARERQVLDRRQGMNVLGAGARQRLLGDPALGAPVDQPEPLGRIADRNVVGDREVGDQREFLKDADDARLIGGRRRGECDLAPLEQHAALVGLDHPGHDLDERRFAGAVLAEDRVNLAGFDREIRLLQRLDASIPLGDALHPEQGDRVRLHPPTNDERRGRRTLPRRPSPRCRYLFSLFCAMISWAVKLILQVGKELPTKKLSDCFE